MSRHLNDAELLDRFRADPQGDAGRAAAAEVLSRYRDAVYGWCRRYVGDPELALDLSQDVLLRAFDNLSRFEGRSGLAAWLMVIARNRCLSERRRVLPAFEEEFDLDLLPAPGPDPAQLAEAREGEAHLLATIRECLDPLESEAVWMRCVEGLPVDAITKLLELEDDSGARGLLQRARRKLRRARVDLDGGQR